MDTPVKETKEAMILKWSIAKGLNSVEKVIGGILVGVLFVVLIIQISFRSIGLSATWTDECARYLFILLTYVGAGLAMLLGKHIKIDIMIAIWPRRVRQYVEVIGSIVATLFCMFVTYSTIQYNIDVVMAAGRVSPNMGIPMSVPYVAVTIGYFLMMIRLIQVEVVPGIKHIVGKDAMKGGEQSC